MTEPVGIQTSGTVTLAITGMTCAGCARMLERVLSRVPGVQQAAVDFDRGLAMVSGTAAPAELIAPCEAAGYGASECDGMERQP